MGAAAAARLRLQRGGAVQQRLGAKGVPPLRGQRRGVKVRLDACGHGEQRVEQPWQLGRERGAHRRGDGSVLERLA